jgi:hypothetical protein
MACPVTQSTVGTMQVPAATEGTTLYHQVAAIPKTFGNCKSILEF